MGGKQDSFMLTLLNAYMTNIVKHFLKLCVKKKHTFQLLWDERGQPKG